MEISILWENCRTLAYQEDDKNVGYERIVRHMHMELKFKLTTVREFWTIP